jgi:hypothetical protein
MTGDLSSVFFNGDRNRILPPSAAFKGENGRICRLTPFAALRGDSDKWLSRRRRGG